MRRAVQGYYPPGPQTVRPAGVTILAVLYFIIGIAAMIGFFLLAYFLASAPGIALICGGIGILIGVFDFLVGWGLLTLQPWAHTAAIVLAIIQLFNFPIGTILSIIILIYLFQPEIKAAFGQGPPPMMVPGYYPPPVQPYPYQYPATADPARRAAASRARSVVVPELRAARRPGHRVLPELRGPAPLACAR